MRLHIRYGRLVCATCSSSRSFPCGLLQIPPRGGQPCRRANGSPVGSEEDLHLQMDRPCQAHVKKRQGSNPDMGLRWEVALFRDDDNTPCNDAAQCLRQGPSALEEGPSNGPPCELPHDYKKSTVLAYILLTTYSFPFSVQGTCSHFPTTLQAESFFSTFLDV